MKLTTTALAIAFAVSGAPAAAQYGMAPPPAQPPQIPNNIPSQAGSSQNVTPAAKDGSAHPSGKALKALVDLQKAVNSNDTASIPAKLAAAQAVASTKDDHYLIAQLQLKAAVAANDDVATASAIDAVAASGFASPATVAQLYGAVGSKFYNAKQFDRAAAAFERASALNPSDSQILINLAESRVSQGRKADAVALLQRAIQLRTAAGQKPEEAMYKRAVGIAYDQQMPGTTELAREWIAAYPSPLSWRNGLALYQNLSKPDVEGALDALRLMRATGAMSNSADYSLYATAAAEQLNYNEAQAVVDEGLAAKHIDPTSPLFRDIIKGLKAKQKATDADLAEASKTAKSGMLLLRIGDRYYGMGEYAKAIELYHQSMGKAGVDPNLANMHLGMALARSGDKAGAASAFHAVSGNLAEIAKYWLIYTQQA
jgi:tetratricopeptide (TPR) repeat protein